MQRAFRDRRWLTLCGVGLVGAGLASRAQGMPAFIVLYAGDVLWGSLFFTFGAWLLPRATTFKLWVLLTLVVELIEVSQLYQAPWAQALRATHFGGLLLGHLFLWSDVVCVAAGTSIAGLIDWAWRR